MNKKDLYKNIKKKRSYLCVGLDSDLNKIPKHLLKYEEPIFEFNNIENKKQQISENVMNYSKKIISPSQEEFVKHKNFLNKELKKNFFN